MCARLLPWQKNKQRNKHDINKYSKLSIQASLKRTYISFYINCIYISKEQGRQITKCINFVIFLKNFIPQGLGEMSLETETKFYDFLNKNLI